MLRIIKTLTLNLEFFVICEAPSSPSQKFAYDPPVKTDTGNGVMESRW